MIIPIIQSNPKNLMSICFIESRDLVTFLKTYCLKVSLSKKLILSQFSQKRNHNFHFFKWKQNWKQKQKRKKKKSYL